MFSKVNLFEICSPKQWKTISGNEILNEGKYPVYGANGIIGYFNEYNHESETLLITCRGATCGTLNISLPKSYINGNAMALDNLSNNVEIKYLFYSLSVRGFRDIITGSAQPQITKVGLEKIKIPLPPLSVQKSIAEKLDKADALRKKDQELLAQYDELAQSIFIDMFGDPVKNEKGWEISKIENIILTIDNIGRQKFAEKIQYVDISSIDNVRKKITKTAHFNLDKRPSRAQQILKKGDVLLSTVRPNLKNIAINDVDDYIGSTGFFVFRCKKEIINKNYLFEALNSDSVTEKFERMVSGANYPALKSSDIKIFELAVPPLSLQNQFAEKIKNIEAQKAILKQQAQESENLFQALLQESFSF